MSAIEIGSCGDESAGFDAALALNGIRPDEVRGDVFEDSEVIGGMTGAGAHLIIGDDDIHAPVQTVLDLLDVVEQIKYLRCSGCEFLGYF